jgi:hypothetical protein
MGIGVLERMGSLAEVQRMQIRIGAAQTGF